MQLHIRKYLDLLIRHLIEMNDIMKIVISLKDSGLLIKGVSETTKNEAKELIGGVLGMLLGILSASLLRILLTG